MSKSRRPVRLKGNQNNPLGFYKQVPVDGKIENVFFTEDFQTVHTVDGYALPAKGWIYELKQFRRRAALKAKFVRAKKPRRSSDGEASRELIAQYSAQGEKKSNWAEQLRAALS